MNKTKEDRRYEDSAEEVTVTGWACKHCKRWWGKDKHMASYCCSTSFPCECGQRYGKHKTRCDSCQEKADTESWYAKPEVEWDGKYPIADWARDEYFWGEDDLIEHIYEIAEEYGDTMADVLDEMRLTTCIPNNGRHFEMSEYLCDELPEDGTLDDEDINRTVNEWIDNHSPFSWNMTGKRLKIDDVRKVIARRLE